MIRFLPVGASTRLRRRQEYARDSDVKDVDDAEPFFRFRIREALFHRDKGCRVLCSDRHSQWLPRVAVKT